MCTVLTNGSLTKIIITGKGRKGKRGRRGGMREGKKRPIE